MPNDLAHLRMYRGCDNEELHAIISKFHRLNTFFDVTDKDTVHDLCRFLLEEVFIASGKRPTPVSSSFHFVFELFCKRNSIDSEIDKPPFSERDFIFALSALDIPIWRKGRNLYLTFDSTSLGDSRQYVSPDPDGSDDPADGGAFISRVEFEKRSDVQNAIRIVIERSAGEKALRTMRASVAKLQADYEILQFARLVKEIIATGIKIVDLNDILRKKYGAKEYMLPRIKTVARERGWLANVRRTANSGRLKLSDENQAYVEKARLRFGLDCINDALNRVLRDFRLIMEEQPSTQGRDPCRSNQSIGGDGHERRPIQI